MIIGLNVRHYKAYKNVNFIPIGNNHNFVAYTGENGVGKSSILEALDTFINNKDWLLTKDQKAYNSYICPLFLIPKEKVTRLKNYFENISDFFWNLEKKEKTDKFFIIRDGLGKEDKNSNYLIYLGEGLDNNWNRKLEIPFGKSVREDFDRSLDNKFSEKSFLKELKEIYSYVYIPVEINSESFTKIETKEMQKIFNKEIKNEIKKSLKQTHIDLINKSLNDFVGNLEEKLEGKYFYDTGDEGTKNLTQKSLMETVLEMYFKKRVLNKGTREKTKVSKKMSELSAGEKREALINLIYVFLKEKEKRDTIIIIGIDEPENSLHTSLCYEQFEKLKIISNNSQVLITTHWYGFLPIIDKGTVHFLNTIFDKKGEEGIEFFKEIDLYDYSYQTKKIPKDFTLKSTNDLVQSIFHSLKTKESYNWLICEGTSDKEYLTYFLKDEVEKNHLKIIAVGGVELVKKFYQYLLFPVGENIDDIKKGKVFCLTDTDSNLRKKEIEQDNKLRKKLIIKRLTNDINNTTTLINFETELRQTPIDIEQSLNPIIFKKTLDELLVDSKFIIDEENIQNNKGNTTKDNLRNFDILEYFINEEVKNNFSKKYIEVMLNEQNPIDSIPSWIEEIKTFFNL